MGRDPQGYAGTPVAAAIVMRTSLALLVALAGCGSDTPTSNPPDVDAAPADGFEPLISSEWTLPPGSQKYLCVRRTVDTDVWITSLRPISPTGTHHSVLMVGDPDGADGTVECDSSLTKPALYGSGVGSQQLDLPPGVAVHVRPGQQLLLNLHLFNSADQSLTGTSGVDVKPIDPAQVVHEAGIVLAGNASFTIPDGGTTTITGTCTTPAGATVFAVGPHMHLLATWMKVSYTDAAGGNPRVLRDASYTFDEQQFGMLSPMLPTVKNGKLSVACTYENHTGHPVSYGEHTEDEMCYAVAFVYPPPPVTVCTH